ncbi:MAG: FGGY-family carbohydrate kinase [Litoreibacter sp.]|nr:FGGY-family carbohydrate kinase [Litoreibacter sp.]
MPTDVFIGLDIGTSGARALAINEAGEVLGSCAEKMQDDAEDRRDPMGWRAAAFIALGRLIAQIEPMAVRTICVDGTSGTMLPIDGAGAPLATARMYNDSCNDPAVLQVIADHAPSLSAAHGATSGLAKAHVFAKVPGVIKVVHQADWIAGELCGRYMSDDNNALKTGYDPVAGRWPDWIEKTGLPIHLLPSVQEPGTTLGFIKSDIASMFGLAETTMLMSGTTDGCAAFLATGAQAPGDGVTSLGTTLVLKLLSDIPIFAPEYGIYSHHIMGLWLAGGASNTGGGVLLNHFSADEISDLSASIKPEAPLNLGYYPLSKPGERFPVADPTFAPLISPRPEKDAEFLQALFEGIASVETQGYRRLAELGAPNLRSVRSVGGGAGNTAWTKIRSNALGVSMPRPVNTEAAYGSAVLARYGLSR